MILNQQYGGSEHSSAGSRLSTDLHGLVAGAIAVTGMSAEVKMASIKELGSAYEVAQAQPEAEDLPVVELKLRYSLFQPWEQAFRTKYGLGPTDRVELGAYPLICTIVNEAFDPNSGAALPTRTMEFRCKYIGSKPPDVDRSSGDGLVVTIKLKQTTPVTVH